MKLQNSPNVTVSLLFRRIHTISKNVPYRSMDLSNTYILCRVTVFCEMRIFLYKRDENLNLSYIWSCNR